MAHRAGVSDPRHLLGQRAEDTVAAWLERAGWRILARRQRSAHGGEVDLIARDPNGTLVALEVRARRSPRTGAAATTVDRRRIARLRRTLAAYASDASVGHRGLRVDLVTLEPAEADHGRWRLRRIPGIG
jgi:putative endonuclease